jgi:hypothetical protein
MQHKQAESTEKGWVRLAKRSTGLDAASLNTAIFVGQILLRRWMGARVVWLRDTLNNCHFAAPDSGEPRLQQGLMADSQG